MGTSYSVVVLRLYSVIALKPTYFYMIVHERSSIVIRLFKQHFDLKQRTLEASTDQAFNNVLHQPFILTHEEAHQLAEEFHEGRRVNATPNDVEQTYQSILKGEGKFTGRPILVHENWL